MTDRVIKFDNLIEKKDIKEVMDEKSKDKSYYSILAVEITNIAIKENKSEKNDNK